MQYFTPLRKDVEWFRSEVVDGKTVPGAAFRGAGHLRRNREGVKKIRALAR